MTNEMQAPSEPRPAGFWERFLAFCVDLFVVRLLALAVFIAAMAGGAAPGPGPLTLLLLVFFFGYHALWKGASPGARLLGLRAVGAAGEPLNGQQGLRRALGGMLYDKSAGTRVVGLKPRGGLGKAVVYASCAGIILVNGSILAYNRIVKPELDKAESVATANSMLNTLAIYEEIYKSKAGGYTDDIFMVAGMSEKPETILKAVRLAFADGKVKIVLSDGAYTLHAAALDPARTPVSFRGPKKLN